ncbi:1-deoxy-D-xylulose-5-phosphate reductoisomerase [Corynebacterium tapiri]|uniref:1-deoxy-D-xylulose 5-phosphate reductoisomerase n=1 Tax=Corynebacterium tapiri TaxID=1448266 RepID=A0A5C4U683_9CORY|nr:1-deoxy-D-xylulose-5-phosphate reductoisomerase [Corynebacterium tapiri]TNL99284.1 1-deoxy-D-xylulose-5-phosphate reductoisomerase [Corynebacterium tapiri]
MTDTQRRVIVLGSTGSIGIQALDILRRNPQRFQLVGIAAAGSDPATVVAQAQEFGLSPSQVAVSREDSAREISEQLGGKVLREPHELVQSQDSDVVLNALVGSMGLRSTVATIESGRRLALANKESLVAGGTWVTKQAAEGQIIPVDSEHSAMAQCLRAGTTAELDRLVLTASGGPFRGWTREQMRDVTPEQAAAHPTWSMGQMNTLNSATLINKGLELIEATLLFDVPADRIDVTVHPQSIVHSMATFKDGATIAQASPPSMLLPIAHALAWPERVDGAQHALDFTAASQWEFEPVDNEAFPAIELARHVASHGATLPAVYNAANEEAAEAFLHKRIPFTSIVDIVAEVVSQADGYAVECSSIEAIQDVEKQAREQARTLISRETR